MLIHRDMRTRCDVMIFVTSLPRRSSYMLLYYIISNNYHISMIIAKMSKANHASLHAARGPSSTPITFQLSSPRITYPIFANVHACNHRIDSMYFSFLIQSTGYTYPYAGLVTHVLLANLRVLPSIRFSPELQLALLIDSSARDADLDDRCISFSSPSINPAYFSTHCRPEPQVHAMNSWAGRAG